MARLKDKPAIALWSGKSIRLPMPPPLGFIPPCIPMRAYKVPAGPDWVHEIKHDGYRRRARSTLPAIADGVLISVASDGSLRTEALFSSTGSPRTDSRARRRPLEPS
jgi:hypothetical protein